MTQTRLRQLVFASENSSDIATLQAVLGLGTPYIDPGVGEFGLTNGVFSLGDQFLEIVVPTQPNTAAGRFMSRSGGVGGYMAIFQTGDIASVRSRADAANIRRVWNTDLPDITASHLHPADLGAAIVSIDEARPASSWRWGGPNWQANSTPGAIIGAALTSPDPQALATRWASVLGLTAAQAANGWAFPLAEGSISVTTGEAEHLSAFHLKVPEPDAVIARAEQAGFETSSTGFTAMGVDVTLTAI